MRKLLSFLIFQILIVSCYDEYVVDYDFDGVYFPNPINVRTVVVGEGLKIKVGAEIGGILENKKDRNVNFIIDNNLITPTILEEMKNHSWSWVSDPASKVSTLQPLPSDFYSLSDPGKIIIKQGWHSGNVTLKVDSAKFLNNIETINPIYAVPFYITSADADTILEDKRSTIIGLRYENMFFGNYLYGGVTTVKDASGKTIETIHYPTTVSQVNEIMRLTTMSPNKVVTNGYSINRTNKNELMLTINGKNISLNSAPGSTNTYEPEGTSSFNGAKLLQNRKLFINYKYQEGDYTYYCQDTLTFRNRIRDGVNEWQDENPGNYR